jgi:hypothetical protein
MRERTAPPCGSTRSGDARAARAAARYSGGRDSRSFSGDGVEVGERPSTSRTLEVEMPVVWLNVVIVRPAPAAP